MAKYKEGRKKRNFFYVHQSSLARPSDRTIMQMKRYDEK
jgi:hypothetical protein